MINIAENSKNGNHGKPVIGEEKAIKSKKPAAKNKLVGLDKIWIDKSEPKATPPPVARVITIPDEIAIKRDGTCEAKPSPMVKIVYFETASEAGIPFNRIPIIKPPMMLIKVMIIPAMEKKHLEFHKLLEFSHEHIFYFQ